MPFQSARAKVQTTFIWWHQATRSLGISAGALGKRFGSSRPPARGTLVYHRQAVQPARGNHLNAVCVWYVADLNLESRQRGEKLLRRHQLHVAPTMEHPSLERACKWRHALRLSPHHSLSTHNTPEASTKCVSTKWGTVSARYQISLHNLVDNRHVVQHHYANADPNWCPLRVSDVRRAITASHPRPTGGSVLSYGERSHPPQTTFIEST